MGTIRVVLDTNVIVSALGFGGQPLEALLRTFDNDQQLIVSEETLTELERVMQYDRLPFTATEREQYLTIVRLEATVVDPDCSINHVRDTDDNKFIECAVEADADYLVSGDKDLLVIESYQGIPILPLEEFVETTERQADH